MDGLYDTHIVWIKLELPVTVVQLNYMSEVSTSRCDELKLLVVNNKMWAFKIIIIVYSVTNVAIN